MQIFSVIFIAIWALMCALKALPNLQKYIFMFSHLLIYIDVALLNKSISFAFAGIVLLLSVIIFIVKLVKNKKLSKELLLYLIFIISLLRFVALIIFLKNAISIVNLR